VHKINATSVLGFRLRQMATVRHPGAGLALGAAAGAAATRRLGALGGMAQIEAQASIHQSFFSSRMYYAVIGVKMVASMWATMYDDDQI